MNYKLSLLLSTTLMMSGCASFTEKFNDGMAFLFDEPATETEPSSAYATPDGVADEQLRATAQSRQERQEEGSINAFVPEEGNSHTQAQDDYKQMVGSTAPAPHSAETASQGMDDTEQNDQLTARTASDSQKNDAASQEQPDTGARQQQSDAQAPTQKSDQSRQKGTSTQSPSTKPESDEAQFAYRGYQDPLRNGFYPRQTHKRVVDYASQLAMELMDNAMGLNTNELVGVTSFVRLNTSLSDTTILGNQLAEYLITELQAYGVGVLDFKVTDGIRVTPRGDIAMSRSGERMAQSVQMDHILTGTMVEDPRGVRINARIVAVNSKRVVASASIHIPAFVVTSLYAGQSSAP